MPALVDGLGAQVRWRPGRFLGLNDIAYSLGGRIVVIVDPHSVQLHWMLAPRGRAASM